jgi:hypothetical protein
VLALIILVLAVATHRLTRIVTRDQIPLVKIPRDAFVTRWGAPQTDSTGQPMPRELRNVSYNGKKTNGFMRSLAYLWECDWCASIWISAGLTYLTWLWTELGEQHWYFAVLVSLAASSVTGLIAQREPD